MRGKQFFVGFAAAAALCAPMFAGCGGDSEPNPATTPVDSGTSNKDSSAGSNSDPKSDASTTPPTITDAAVVCVNDANFTTGDITDAPLGDSGATTVSCVACIRTKCANELGTCQGECECRETITRIFTCPSKPGDVLACFQEAFASASPSALPVGACLVQQCGSKCAIPSAGGNPGPRDAATGG
jgi:hypothetical protein